MTFWTNERVTELRGHFEAGLTAGEIARDMHAPSRCAVLGKLHRMGLKHEDNMAVRIRRMRQGIASAGPRSPPAPRLPRPRPAPISAPLVPEAAPPPAPEPSAAHRCDLLELRNESCRWPIGDEPPFMFCGTPEADAAGGYSYCIHHMRIAHDRRGDRGPAKTVQPGMRQWGAAG